MIRPPPRLRGAHAALAVAFLLAAWVRLSPHAEALGDGVVLPFGNDAPYHVRRILRLAADLRYPGLFDPLLDWPRGAATHWSPGFDFAGALLTILLGGAHDPRRAALVIACLPVVYGLLAVIATAALVRRVLPTASPYVAAAAALFAGLLPQSVTIAQVGFVDHHVTEVLFTALLWRWTVWRTELAERRTPAFRFEALGALLVTAAAWTQSVGLLYVGVAAIALIVAPFVSPRDRALAGSGHGGGSPPTPLGPAGAPALAAGAVLLAILFAPAVREHGHAFAYEWPSYFQPACFALAAIAVALSSAIAPRLRSLPPRALALAAAAIALALGVALALLFALVPAARGLLAFVTTSGTEIAGIAELRPLFAAPTTPDGSRWDQVEGFFGPAAYVLPILLPLGLAAARRAGRDRFASALVWTLALLAMSLWQNRWSRPFTVPIAVTSALGLWFLADHLVRYLDARRPAPLPAGTPAIAAFFASAAALILPDPGLVIAPPPLRSSTAILEAGMFLRAQKRAPEPGKESGILAPWSVTFQLLQLSGLPTLATGHAWIVGEDGYRLERAAWSGSRDALWALMRDRDLGFVVAGAGNLARLPMREGQASLTGPDGRIDWHYFERVPLGTMILGGTALPDLGVPHLDQLCPRFVSSEFAPYEVPLPRLWVYERVRGALLEGHAAPKSRVLARLRLRHAAGVVPYDAFTEADANGAFSLRFPVPTGMKEATLLAVGRVRVERQGTPPVEVDVPDQAVRAGDRIAVPDQ